MRRFVSGGNLRNSRLSRRLPGENSAAARRICSPAGSITQRHRPLGSRPLGNWDVFEFSPPSVEDAVDVLLNVGGSETAAPLLVGIGATWPDRVMLRHVHVPVVVRSQLIDQGELRSRFPHAYVTNAFGPRGWSEAILGSA